MSILQNTTALQNEQTELQSLLESVNALPEALTTETWILTLEDGSTVTKEVYVE